MEEGEENERVKRENGEGKTTKREKNTKGGVEREYDQDVKEEYEEKDDDDERRKKKRKRLRRR